LAFEKKIMSRVNFATFLSHFSPPPSLSLLLSLPEEKDVTNITLIVVINREEDEERKKRG